MVVVTAVSSIIKAGGNVQLTIAEIITNPTGGIFSTRCPSATLKREKISFLKFT
jgi:hypothetical protein